jgi:aldehyde:ferredoxin oxidoreductase
MQNEYGYAGKILRVNLSSGLVSHLPTGLYADRFIGGRGVAARIYWDLVPPDVGALDPGNCLIFVNGPVAGFPGLAGSRWQVLSKSPAPNPEHFCYCNLGGHWGAQLKFAGYDGIVVEGAADKPVYLVIRDDDVQIKDASHLWQKTAVEVRETIKGELGRDMRVVAPGPAGDNLVTFASLLADNDASGSSGMGAVMGSKKLKAIAIRGTGKIQAADPERLRSLMEIVRRLKQPPAGTFERVAPKGSKMKREACFGCIGTCAGRIFYQADDGTRGKMMCQSGTFYGGRAQQFYGERTETFFFANRLCDAYGLDTMVVDTTLRWLTQCAKAGILNDENTGLPLSKMGSLEFIEAFVKQVAFREGFGDVLAHGPTRAAAIVGQGSADLITDYIAKADQGTSYGPRMYITTGLLYAMEPRQPIQQLHEVSRPLLKWVNWHRGGRNAYMTSEMLRQLGKRFWGSEEATDLSTYAGKALAAKKVQDRQYAKESLILCDFSWPITEADTTEDHMGDPTLESQVYSAVTGRETDEEGLNLLGERIFNLQRAILAREGHLGREGDRLPEVFFKYPLKSATFNPECWAPGKDGQPFQKTGTVVDREKFEEIKTEYYSLREWDPKTGLQTEAKLRALGLDEVVADLAKRGALAG